MYDFSKFNREAEAVTEHFKSELASVRAGRVMPQLVEGIKADCYGTMTPITHVASITVADQKTLVIQPWDRNLLPAIEKAISSSQLGINPVSDGIVLRIVMPELTGERRIQLAKIIGEKLEEAKISLRILRSQTTDDIAGKEKNKEFGEDEKFRLKDALQKKVDETIARLEEIAQKKKDEINL